MSGLQRKSIDKYIATKIQYWTWSIREPNALRKVLELKSEGASVSDWSEADQKTVKDFRTDIASQVTVTGGCIASLLLGEEVNDVDIYFTNREIAAKVASYYLHTLDDNLVLTDKVSESGVIDNPTGGVAIFIKSQGITSSEIDTSGYDYFESMTENAIDEFLKANKSKLKEDKKYGVRFITSNAITLNDGIQLILRFCGNAAEIHNNYDFVHATNYWTKSTGLVYNEQALQSLLERRLVYIGSLFPLASLFRIRKFINRGFKISAGEITKIAWDLHKLDLSNPAVLHDQLIGVDYAYFHQVINILKEGIKGGQELDRTYLFKVIDEVFQDESDTENVPAVDSQAENEDQLE